MDLEARFGSLSIVSVYLPSGSEGPERQATKFRFMDQIATPATAQRAQAASIYRKKRFSDHEPLVLDYARELG